jgi:hypothetical protein
MTQEDQYAIIGKAHEDYLATKREFAAIEVRGRKIAEVATNLAEAILEPARVVVPTPGEGAILTGVRDPFLFGPQVAAQFTQDYVRRHVEEYKTTKKRLAAFRQQLISLGQPDPER